LAREKKPFPVPRSPFPHRNPPRALDQERAEQRERQCRQRLRAEHPAPCRVAQPRRSYRPVHDLRYDHSDDDVELEERAKSAPAVGRRDLRDVDRRGNGRNADADAADEAGRHQGMRPARKGAPHRRKEIEYADAEQRRLAAEPVAYPAAGHRADDGAPEGHAHHPSVHHGRERPYGLYLLLAAVYDSRVVPEQEPAHRRRKRQEPQPPALDFAVHSRTPPSAAQPAARPMRSTSSESGLSDSESIPDSLSAIRPLEVADVATVLKSVLQSSRPRPSSTG